MNTIEPAENIIAATIITFSKPLDICSAGKALIELYEVKQDYIQSKQF